MHNKQKYTNSFTFTAKCDIILLYKWIYALL